MYHDYGYKFEEKDLDVKICNRLKNGLYIHRNYLYKKFGINIKKCAPNFMINKIRYVNYANKKHISYDDRIADINYYQGNIQFENGILVKKAFYSGYIKSKYLLYCIKVRNKLDHGIMGSDFMYSQLYVSLMENISVENNYINFDKKQLKIFAYIADCIASHNIWKCPSGYDDMYKAYRLDVLVGKRFKKISFIESPLLYILCVCDSIDPTKYFDNKKECLKNVSFSFNKNEHTILISCSDTHNLKYIKNLLSLEEWIDCKVIMKNEVSVNLILNF